MEDNKIVPSLWFSADGGKVSEVVGYYKKVFGGELKEHPIVPLGITPSGNTEMCFVELFGRKYCLMSTEQEHHPFNDSVAFTINCEDQLEIDRIWDYFTKEGAEAQCGWCKDKYGLRWQVIPHYLGELLQMPNGWQVMMKQKKIVIGEYGK